jgi:predicted acyltransferase
LTGMFDRMFMPGHLYLKVHDPEGLLSTLPAISTALLGMLTGQYVMSEHHRNPMKKVLFMVIAAAALMIVGKLWNIVFPINKNLWTSSFVCFVGGLSLLLFTIFYMVIDVWNYKKWTTFFVVIGLNSITIYLAHRIIDFERSSQFLFGGFVKLFPESLWPILHATAFVMTSWIFLYFLYKKKIFLKV